MGDPDVRQNFARELYAIARSSAKAHGRSFKPIADAEMQRLTQRAAAEVISPSAMSHSRVKAKLTVDERKEEARLAVKKLVTTMATAAKSFPGYANDLLGERTLTEALTRSGLCPCWPIC